MCTYVNAVELPYSRIQYPRFHLSAINYEESTSKYLSQRGNLNNRVIHNCNLSSTLQIDHNDESYSI